MYRFTTLFLTLAACLGMQAQTDFLVQFADKNGNVIANGTTLNLTEYETDGFGDIQLPAGLYVKNTTSAPIPVKGKYTVETLDNGIFQTCFPENCMTHNATGSYETQQGQLNASELRNMQTEWKPTAEGNCKVTYQLYYWGTNDFGGQSFVEGPKVTLNFTYSKSTDIDAVISDVGIRSITYYDLTGRPVTGVERFPHAQGVYIRKVVHSNGTTTVSKYQK